MKHLPALCSLALVALVLCTGAIFKRVPASVVESRLGALGAQALFEQEGRVNGAKGKIKIWRIPSNANDDARALCKGAATRGETWMYVPPLNVDDDAAAICVTLPADGADIPQSWPFSDLTPPAGTSLSLTFEADDSTAAIGSTSLSAESALATLDAALVAAGWQSPLPSPLGGVRLYARKGAIFAAAAFPNSDATQTSLIALRRDTRR